jgi:hypothetical protein
MRDVHLAALAGNQFNRVSLRQLLDLGYSESAIVHRKRAGRLVQVEDGVFALPPVRDDDKWGRWMGATLTAPGTALSHASAAVAYGALSIEPRPVMVTRPGTGGPRRHGGTLVHRSTTLEGDVTDLRGIPITTAPRTLLDIACRASERALARAVREAVRLDLVSLTAIGDALGKHHGRRGSRRLAGVLARYAGLPLDRARSGAEVRAMEILRDAGRPLPRLNVRVAGIEADLSWPDFRLIIEIDGGPFHLDAGEDARKEAAWKTAGWEVRRVASNDVYEEPWRLLTLAPR